MRRRALLAALPALAVAARAGERLRVVATFSVLGDMVREVGGDAVDVTVLVPRGGDVHAWQPRPSALAALRRAGVVVRNGLGLEGWLDRLVPASGTRALDVVASRGVAVRHVREGGGGESVDPHIWQDPRRGQAMARTIAEGLARADAGRAEEYRERGRVFAARIGQLDAWIAAQFSPVPPQRRRIITDHDAFGYYGARYGITFLAAQGIGAGSGPSAKALAALARQVRAQQARAVFLEALTDPRLMRSLAQDTGAAIGGTVYADTLSPEGGPAPTYVDMLRHNTTLFARALKET